MDRERERKGKGARAGAHGRAQKARAMHRGPRGGRAHGRTSEGRIREAAKRSGRIRRPRRGRRAMGTEGKAMIGAIPGTPAGASAAEAALMEEIKRRWEAGNLRPSVWLIDGRAIPHGKALRALAEEERPDMAVLYCPDGRTVPLMLGRVVDSVGGGTPVTVESDDGWAGRERRALGPDPGYGILALREDGQRWALTGMGRLIRRLGETWSQARVRVVSEDMASRSIIDVARGDGQDVGLLTEGTCRGEEGEGSEQCHGTQP